MKKNNNFIYNKKGGAAGFILIFIIVSLSIIIYIGYQKYQERYYLNLYDDETIDRTIELPPFVDRLTSSDKELIGECDLHIKTSFQQVTEFYDQYSHKCGFSFESTTNSFKISIRKNYIIEGSLVGEDLLMRWYPVLNKNQTQKAKKLFGSIKKKPEKEDIGY